MNRKIFEINLEKHQHPLFYRLNGKLVQIETIDQDIENQPLYDINFQKIKDPKTYDEKVVFPMFRILKSDMSNYINKIIKQMEEQVKGDSKYNNANIIIVKKDYGNEVLIGSTMDDCEGGIKIL